MKKLLFVLLTCIFLPKAFSCYFDDNPIKEVTKSKWIAVIYYAHSLLQWEFILQEPDGIIQNNIGIWNQNSFDSDITSTFPLTINIQFSGFDYNDGQKTNRACLLYLDKNGYWRIIKQIKDVNWDIQTNTGNKRAMFGQYVINDSLGYKNGEIMFVICYFESNTHSTHNLNELLSTKQTTSTLIPQRLQNLGAIAIRVVTNRKPL